MSFINDFLISSSAIDT